MWMDRQTDVRHINLIGGLVTRNPPKNGAGNTDCEDLAETSYWSFSMNQLEIPVKKYGGSCKPYVFQ